MPNWSFILLASVAAVGFFVVGLSLTLLFKGHHIDSEISTNKHMQRLGIKCAVQEAREADGSGSCAESGAPTAGCTGNCGACDIERSAEGEPRA